MNRKYRELKILKSSSETCLKVESADGFVSRFLGLMFRKTFGGADALLLSSCGSIHTFFMRFTIDVLCLDDKGFICDIRKGLRPWKIFIPRRKTRDIIEMPEGSIARLAICEGEKIVI